MVGTAVVAFGASGNLVVMSLIAIPVVLWRLFDS
jgi:hypothetical protein